MVFTVFEIVKLAILADQSFLLARTNEGVHVKPMFTVVFRRYYDFFFKMVHRDFNHINAAWRRPCGSDDFMTTAVPA